MNRVCLVGNLGKDPELKQTKKGGSVCNITIATSETIFDKQKNEKKDLTEWHNVVVWGKQGENCAKYLKKGSKVAIEGSLRTESYEKDGVKKWSTKIMAHRVEFLSSQNQPQYDSTSEQPFPDELPPMPDGFYDSIPF